MLNAAAAFSRSIDEARHLTSLYDYMSGQIKVPYPFDDLLRAQVVYTVGAFDKLLHDVIRIGMREIFTGKRPPTTKYHSEVISLEFHAALVGATIPPKEHLFDLEIVKKLRWQSFQRPDAVAEGLSLIWDEKHKWAKIAAAMAWNKEHATTKLKLIATRRNAIVHESDVDPLNGTKNPLTKAECVDMTDFIRLCGDSIVGLVK